MARIRSVKPGYFTSLDTAGQLSRTARLHFVGLWTYADDHGRGIDDPRLLKAAIWPLDDDINTPEIEALQNELSACGRIVRYRDDRNGRLYFEVTNWPEHQKPNRPQDSPHPSPTSSRVTVIEPALNDHGTISDRSVNAHDDLSGPTHANSGDGREPVHNVPDEDGLLEGRGEEGRGEVPPAHARDEPDTAVDFPPPPEGGNPPDQEQTPSDRAWNALTAKLPDRVRRRLADETPAARRKLVTALERANDAGLKAADLKACWDDPTPIDDPTIESVAAVLATRITKAANAKKRPAR